MLSYIDLETTGLEDDDRICAIALITENGGARELLDERVKPPRKIRPEAMAVHHITNEAVAASPAFSASRGYAKLASFNVPEGILVGHNIAFDLMMLQREGVLWQGSVIDTLKCMRHLVPDLEQFGLQYLRYELGLYKEEADIAREMGVALRAHSAISDAFHVMLLHRYLREMADDERLCALSLEPVLLSRFDFGKYKGRYIEEIASIDPGYLHWMLGAMFDMDEDLRYSVTYFLGEVR